MPNRPRRTLSPRQPTMSDVAAKVGVSRQLVGLVFNGSGSVHPETEARIRAAARAIGFRPNLAAQSLRQESSRYLGVVFHSGESSMEELIPYLYRYAENLGYKLMLSAVSPLRSEELAIEEVQGHRCEGIILIASQLSKRRIQILAKELPMVSVGRRLSGVKCGVVSSWGEKGVASAVQHLVSLGHTQIACINALAMNDGQFRTQGYLTAMNHAGLKPDVLDIDGDFGEMGGAVAAATLLEREWLPTAVICNNDQSAMGLAYVLQREGIGIPNEISVVGYDDTLARWPFLDLTTVRQDGSELASEAIADLVARIRGERPKSKTVLTSAKLVTRGSSAAPSVSRRPDGHCVKD